MKSLLLALLLVVLLPCNNVLLSQEAEKISPRLDFTYLKKADESKLLKVVLDVYKKKVSYPVVNTNIVFSIGIGFDSLTVRTNSEGIAYLIIDKNHQFAKNEEGFASLNARFDGNDTLEGTSQEILVKDAFVQLKLEMVDTIRTVNVHLSEISSTGDTVAVVGETVNLYVPRMINMLKIGEGTTDDDGNISVEFPIDLPGNSDSTITVIARVEENEKFANIESRETAPWGVPIIHRIPGSHRELWSQIAPTWMIITLTVMLLGVWGHYIFVIIQLILINRENKKQKA